MHTDGITLVAEVIESKTKPSLPWGTLAETAFGGDVTSTDTGDMSRANLALGEQDLDPAGLVPPDGLALPGASGDHLPTDCGQRRLQAGRVLAARGPRAQPVQPLPGGVPIPGGQVQLAQAA